jgi:threonine dehydrogenase-like Zn-dependent dehydrogenase
VAFAPNWPEIRVGGHRDGRPIEWASTMTALAYFGKERMEVVRDRPIVCTDQDIIARVDRVHRCGTDVKIFRNGRPDQCEESLLDELKAIFKCSEPPGKVAFVAYVELAMGGARRADIHDPLYEELAERVAALPEDQRRDLPRLMRLYWGRVLGHETVVTVERVGSRVKDLRKGIGYLDGIELSPDYLDFQPGQKCVLQSRVAYYDPPPADAAGARGVQLLGGNITDLAMNQAGAYGSKVRLTPEMICSGSIIRVPAGVSPEAASLAEPTACLLDCFQKSTHEVGQDANGSILVKGARPGGLACVIGSGSMALMAGQLATLDDPILKMGRAHEVVFVVRSFPKACLVKSILRDRPVDTVICEDEAELMTAVRRQYAPSDSHLRRFNGFDDVIIAAGDAQTVAHAHSLIVPTGGRLLAFAGTRGPCSIESGVWHYGNAGILGTSGCNTKMMEIVLGLFARGSLQPEPLAGKVYTFDDLAQPGGVKAFFDDKNLRPCLAPNA